MLNEALGVTDFKRAFLSKSQGNVIGDIVCPDWFPFAIQAKCCESWSFDALMADRDERNIILRWWEAHQAEVKQSGLALYPMLVFKKNRSPIYVALDDESIHLADLRYPSLIPRLECEYEFDDGFRETLSIMRFKMWLDEHRVSFLWG